RGVYKKSVFSRLASDTKYLNCELISMVVGVFYRYGNTLRFPGRLVSLLVLPHCGVSPRPFLPQESPCISYAGIAFTTLAIVVRGQKISTQPLHSPGKWRVVTPAGTARV